MTRIVPVIAALVAVAVGGYLYMDQGKTGSTSINPLIGAALAQEASEVDTSSIIEMEIGSPDAPITIYEYASYTCPHCAAFHQGAFKEIKKNYIDTGKVRFIYREVYFDRFGLWASLVSRCAGPEKFFGITDLIYKGQSVWSRAAGPAEIVDELKKIGLLAGIEPDVLEACLQDADKAQTLVAWYQHNAEVDDISSTPSFVINGKKVPNQSYADFSAILDAELGN
ncbi:MAG: DsbA family protein [Rhodobacteraceae bacterium]|nr:DsbA family protein [Paracoccaceae bacterium]